MADASFSGGGTVQALVLLLLADVAFFSLLGDQPLDLPQNVRGIDI